MINNGFLLPTADSVLNGRGFWRIGHGLDSRPLKGKGQACVKGVDREEVDER